jgi:hypothetical protein
MPDDDSTTPLLPARAVFWAGVIGVLLFLWFLFAWLILDRHMLDAAGESVGTALFLGVILSVVGAFRGAR